MSKRNSNLKFVYDPIDCGFEISGRIDAKELADAKAEMDDFDLMIFEQPMKSGEDMAQNLEILFKWFRIIDSREQNPPKGI